MGAFGSFPPATTSFSAPKSRNTAKISVENHYLMGFRGCFGFVFGQFISFHRFVASIHPFLSRIRNGRPVEYENLVKNEVRHATETNGNEITLPRRKSQFG